MKIYLKLCIATAHDVARIGYEKIYIHQHIQHFPSLSQLNHVTRIDRGLGSLIEH